MYYLARNLLIIVHELLQSGAVLLLQKSDCGDFCNELYEHKDKTLNRSRFQKLLLMPLVIFMQFNL